MSEEIGVCNPIANPRPPATMSTVAAKPKKKAPLGNRMLAVRTGLGQRRMLLTPLIKKRHPKIIRSTVSANKTRYVGSNVVLPRVRQRNDRNYS